MMLNLEDLYVWKQILSFIKTAPGKNIVYVTNDAKSDFFYKIDGKVRGPNESLVSEAKDNGASEFILQNLNTFLHHANNHLHADVNEDAISELTNASPILKKKKKIPSVRFLNSREDIAKKLQLAFMTNDDLTKRRQEVSNRIAELTQELSYYHSAPVDEFNGAQTAVFENDYKEAMSKLTRLERELAMINSIFHNASLGSGDPSSTVKNDDV
ncbi:PIN-like domain-containing protein [Pantoea sp. EABMAA-21]|uniref:PIN-like domain-containing protein n=1 Tax=Pantoea sp. EABMAA-21 TaxID=3043302 RepID=UPI0024B48648|nr:PIN-like domain-containing protein [Pantoea sp. EABMAA-21]MDI9279995.1 PIN-like domain-containing protein [Pantoea sp. EABMAA-21]